MLSDRAHVLAVLASLGALAVGTGCPPTDRCVFSEDCAPDQLCIANACRQRCDRDTDCASGERCAFGACTPGGPGRDAGSIDTGSVDTSSVDTSSVDTGSVDTGSVDTAPVDTAPGDRVAPHDIDATDAPVVDTATDAATVDISNDVNALDATADDAAASDAPTTDLTTDVTSPVDAGTDGGRIDGGIDGGTDAGPPPGERWRQVSSAASSTCGIREDGSLWCWGDDSYQTAGETEPRLAPTRIGSDNDWRDLITSRGLAFNHRCATKENHTLWCWGDNIFGQLGWPPSLGELEPVPLASPLDWYLVSAGPAFTCGIHRNRSGDGWLYCWGDNSSGQLGQRDTNQHEGPQLVGAGYRLVRASWGNANDGRVCAIKEEGSLWCWGDNSAQQISPAVPGVVFEPWPIMPEASWLDVSPGMTETCGIKTDGSLWCWGLAPLDGDDPSPRQLDVGTTYQALSSSPGFGCGLTTAGQVRCWGVNSRGSLGGGGYQDQPEPAPIDVDITFDQLSTGDLHSCAVATDGRLWCWGYDAHFQLGLGEDSDPLSPQLSLEIAPFSNLAAGGTHICGLASGTRWCWGNNASGQLGVADDDTKSRHRPMEIPEARSWLLFEAGGNSSCGVDSDHLLWCWGDNGAGGLGLGDTAPRHLPEQVSPQGVETVALGNGHTCATYQDRSLWCWGANGFGQLGVFTNGESRLAPQPIDATRSWRSLALGKEHSCAIDASGSLFCWGNNSVGNLGLGDQGRRSTPTQVTVVPPRAWKQVTAGVAHTCAIDLDDTLWCWGHNYFGQAGLDTENQLRPRQISTASWLEVKAGDRFTCGLQTAGGLFCWGENEHGQLGLGDTDNRTELSQIGNGSWHDLAPIGPYGTCAKDPDEGLWCWGFGTEGILGDGRRWQLSPVQVPTL